MSKKSTKESVQCRFFRWLIYSRDGTFYADGRSCNKTDVGRHSLGTTTYEEAYENLKRLDLVMAVEFGIVDQSVLHEDSGNLLPLEKGVEKYLAHVRRPAFMGGARPATVKRYGAVFDKFIAFAKAQGVQYWQHVAKHTVAAYGAWLDDEGYEYATEYIEVTTIKQAMNWMVEEKHIPASCAFTLKLTKPAGTTTYCYQPAEVVEMISFCTGNPELSWLADVIVALSHTGLRISELAGLMWSNIDLEQNRIALVDEQRHGGKNQRARARSTKTHQNRCLPIHALFHGILESMPHHSDGHVFHGPNGGALKPDTVRNILVREVLTPLVSKFPATPGAPGFCDGRLHSFRHFFCSTCANAGVAEQVLMNWLGHRDSKMVHHYYHLHDQEAQRQMMKVNFAGAASTMLAAAKPA